MYHNTTVKDARPVRIVQAEWIRLAESEDQWEGSLEGRSFTFWTEWQTTCRSDAKLKHFFAASSQEPRRSTVLHTHLTYAFELRCRPTEHASLHKYLKVESQETSIIWRCSPVGSRKMMNYNKPRAGLSPENPGLMRGVL
jgi:hypothetical protein